MKYEVYVIYNNKDKRPAIMQNNYGSLIVYLTKEQAEAYQANFEDKEIFEVKKCWITAQ